MHCMNWYVIDCSSSYASIMAYSQYKGMITTIYEKTENDKKYCDS